MKREREREREREKERVRNREIEREIYRERGLLFLILCIRVDVSDERHGVSESVSDQRA